MMLICFELYTFVPVFVALNELQGHSYQKNTTEHFVFLMCDPLELRLCMSMSMTFMETTMKNISGNNTPYIQVR